ncbi:FecR domain-containing protein [Variovorax sp.]|uniref:FecR family protein n=1 Tax=Variovorax sp. TaxID=1871043 RepID=UPI0025D603B2|nr:FecR domain-containing protein [Variovorax sp.]
MTHPGSMPPRETTDAIERQAIAWMSQVAAGRMTQADGAAMRRWCEADPAHRAALAAARRQWTLLGAAGQLVAARAPSSSQPQASTTQRAQREPRFAPGRRALFGGALGFTAVAAAAMVHPPLGLWPSLGELRADHRTGIGERRKVALAEGVTVELNTRSGIVVREGRVPLQEIELIAGEAAIEVRDARIRTVVEAGAGRLTARPGPLGPHALFALRRQGARVVVVCLEGRLEVAHAAGGVLLEAQQQLDWDERTHGPVATLAGAELARRVAWREGYLRFVDTPLGEVIDEINRYRPGQVVLLDEQLAARQMTGRFQIGGLDLAIVQMKQSLGLKVRSLPGGVVLLS